MNIITTLSYEDTSNLNMHSGDLVDINSDPKQPKLQANVQFIINK